MNTFRKTIQGIDFEFELQDIPEENIYKVKTEGISFQMRIDENGLWKIHGNGELSPKVMKLEYKLGKAIDSANENAI